MSSAGGDAHEMHPPKAKGKQNELGASKRKRLACEICRIRRVRCEWQESGTCLACQLGNYQCPGEPTRKKRAKKGEVQPDGALLKLEAELKAFDIGGAITFQLIERGFKHAPPDFPGLATGFYKQYVRTCAGASKEREIAAEVLCAAFVAGTSTFTDHAKIIGSVSPDMPTVTPLGVAYDYSCLIPFGSARSSAVLALSFQSRQIFEDSTMRHRPTPEAMISLIAMDWMANLTREAATEGNGKERADKAESRIDTEYAEVLCRGYRTLMMGRRSEMKAEDLELLLGPVNAYLFACATPLVEYPTLEPGRDWCRELGVQLLPLSYATSLLYRKFIQVPATLCDSAALLEPIWNQIDLSQSNLALILTTLTALVHTPESPQNPLKTELDSIIHTQQLHLAQLDLLVYQRIVQAFIPSTNSSVPCSPALLDNYARSRSRVQDVFRLVVNLARQAIGTFAWRKALQVVQVLTVSSAWTNLGKVEDESANKELLGELGITLEMGQILEQCLALAAWSSPSAARQREGLLLALVSAFGPLPALNLPPPPTTLPTPPSKPTHLSSTVQIAAAPVVPYREEDFQLDLSFLDDFAREHGIPIEDDPPAAAAAAADVLPSLRVAPSSVPSSIPATPVPPRPASPPRPPPTSTDSWTDHYMVSNPEPWHEPMIMTTNRSPPPPPQAHPNDHHVSSSFFPDWPLLDVSTSSSSLSSMMTTTDTFSRHS